MAQNIFLFQADIHKKKGGGKGVYERGAGTEREVVWGVLNRKER